MTTRLQPTMRPAGEAVKAFREYLAVHPDACTRMGGHAMDDMALTWRASRSTSRLLPPRTCTRSASQQRHRALSPP